MSRGGKRQGSGRKQGALTKRTRAIAERAIAENKSPLEIMLENMRHFQQVAMDAEAVLEGMTAEEITGRAMEPDEQFKTLLAEVKKAAGLRNMAQECARDAAPYIHPRLASVNAVVSGSLEIKEPIDRPPRETFDEWEQRKRRELALGAIQANGHANGHSNGNGAS